MMTILDFGNEDAHGNDLSYIKKMIDETARLQEKKQNNKFIIKFQIWRSGNDLINNKLKSTDLLIFNEAYYYAKELGLKVTSSVFDEDSLFFVKQYDPCFIKIACMPEIYYLTGDEDCEFVVSVSNYEWEKYFREMHVNTMYAIRKYPATNLDYVNLFQSLPDFDILDAQVNFSDHTQGFDLYKKYNPRIYECHVGMERRKSEFDNSFVRTFDELEENL